MSTACELIRNKLIVRDHRSDIAVANRLGKKPDTEQPDDRNLLVTLHSEDAESKLLAGAKAAKPHNVFLNKNLIQKRKTIMYVIREA